MMVPSAKNAAQKNVFLLFVLGWQLHKNCLFMIALTLGPAVSATQIHLFPFFSCVKPYPVINSDDGA